MESGAWSPSASSERATVDGWKSFYGVVFGGQPLSVAEAQNGSYRSLEAVTNASRRLRETCPGQGRLALS